MITHLSCPVRDCGLQIEAGRGQKLDEIETVPVIFWAMESRFFERIANKEDRFRTRDRHRRGFRSTRSSPPVDK